ncbi:MAG: hypothetical protein IJL62_01800 [Clostridia bacterium]|nr:hypothetical protein [Clostridia bacterium]
MNAIVRAALTLAACGLVFALCELILPRSGVRRAAEAAIGLLFLELLAEQIAGILQ